MPIIYFVVPDELDDLMRRLTPPAARPIDDEDRTAFVLGLLAGGFKARGEFDLATKLYAANTELLDRRVIKGIH